MVSQWIWFHVASPVLYSRNIITKKIMYFMKGDHHYKWFIQTNFLHFMCVYVYSKFQRQPSKKVSLAFQRKMSATTTTQKVSISSFFFTAKQSPNGSKRNNNGNSNSNNNNNFQKKNVFQLLLIKCCLCVCVCSCLSIIFRLFYNNIRFSA